MRVLLIEEDGRRCAQVRARLTAWRPHARLTVHSPVSQGALAPEFLAQGYDAVLLADAWPGGRGLNWARELAGRAGFAPIVLLRDGTDAAAVGDAAALGAWSVSREELEGDEFQRVLTAAEQRAAHARALWRTSQAGRESQRFGDAFVRGYRRIRRLAAGRLTDLYVGESESAGTLVALKVARDRHEHEPTDIFGRFLQEYEIAQRIAAPGVVRLYDLGVSDEHAWLVMEYFPMGDLRRRMRAAALSVREALLIAIEVARALESVHAAGVLHRDLKPGNVMLRTDGSIALIDFGLSKDTALAADATDSGVIFGTPHYMSPEQGHAEPIDARSDLYSLGVMLYEMLTREKPFGADNPMAIVYKHRKDPVPRLPPGCAALQPLIERLLAKSPAERYASAAEAAQALTRALGQWLSVEGRR